MSRKAISGHSDGYYMRYIFILLKKMATLNPPFRGEDMEGLYKKVIRGYYQKIPSHYS